MSTKNMPEAAIERATEAQLGHILDMWKLRLKKRKLTNAEAQAVITNGGLFLPVMDMAVDVLVDQVRANVNATIVRKVKVNRTRTPQEVVDATGRRQYTDDAVVATMPRGEDDTVEVVFFRLRRFVTDWELAIEYAKRGLKPDPFAQAAVNEQDPLFANRYPNGTHWKRPDGGYDCMVFSRWRGERRVRVHSSIFFWDGYWFFAGVHK